MKWSRSGAVALLSLAALAAATTLFFAAGAQAATCAPADGSLGDTQHTVGSVGSVTVDNDLNTADPTKPTGSATVCANPPDRGVVVGVQDADVSSRGVQGEVTTCAPTGCTTAVNDTGVELGVTNVTQDPAGNWNDLVVVDNNGTCVYVNGGLPNCPFGASQSAVSVANGDMPRTGPTAVTTTCVGTGSSGCTNVPSGATASASLGNDAANSTVRVELPNSQTVERDTGYQCVRVGTATCP